MSEIENDPILSQIVNIIDEHNDNIPEGDYLAIMNRLKIAFQNRPRPELPSPRNNPDEELQNFTRVQTFIKEAILNIQHWMLYFNGSPNPKVIEYNMKILEDVNSDLNQFGVRYLPHMYVPRKTTDEYLRTILSNLDYAKNILWEVKFYNYITRTKQLELVTKINSVNQAISAYLRIVV